MSACEDVRERLLRPDTADPALEAHLAVCVACRELAERERGLEDVLRVLPEPEADAGLAQRVLSNLGNERADARLDAVLGSLPEPETPAGLARRVLAGIEAERTRRSRRPVLLALAALVLLAGALGLARLRARGDGRTNTGEVPSEELLANLELLESWDLVASQDLDLLLGDLDEVDAVLLELGFLEDPGD